jgi:hypothetical protein
LFEKFSESGHIILHKWTSETLVQL